LALDDGGDQAIAPSTMLSLATVGLQFLLEIAGFTVATVKIP
jgi:hypothetical protein